MSSFHSLPKQVAEELRGHLIRGRWVNLMPGREKLAKELGVCGKTVEMAMNILENEGILIANGHGKRRGINVAKTYSSPSSLKLSVLLYERADASLDYMVEIRHQLLKSGHTVDFHDKSLADLQMSVPRIESLVKKSNSDAWIIASGAREVLEWFSQQKIPAFALSGRRTGLSIAGIAPDKKSAYSTAIKRLVSLGHKRIVLLMRSQHRYPNPSLIAKHFLSELKSNNLSIGPYNLPNWDDNVEDFYNCLESLYQSTPPTALIAAESYLFHSTRYYLAQRGLLTPKHVSLICTDPDPNFRWCIPSIAHINWNTTPVVNGVVRWANAISKGRPYQRFTYTKAIFVDGGTVGPANTILVA